MTPRGKESDASNSRRDRVIYGAQLAASQRLPGGRGSLDVLARTAGDFSSLLLAHVADTLGRDADYEAAGRKLAALGDDGARGDYGACIDVRAVEDGTGPIQLAPMPTVLRTGPYRFYFYSHEPNEPPHVHVDRDDLSAKFWLEPVSLARNLGFNARELRRLQSLAM